MDVQFFIKFTKAEWAEDIQNQGRFYFNPAFKFFSSKHYSAGQYDRWDSHINHDAKYLVYAPIIEENETGIKYGPGRKLADQAQVHFIDNRNRNIPICCFRIIYDNEIKDDVLRLNDQLYEKILTEFPEYDSFVLICFPHAFFEVLSKSQWGNKAYGHLVYYGNAEEFYTFYHGDGDEKFEDKYPYLQMFCKEGKTV